MLTNYGKHSEIEVVGDPCAEPGKTVLITRAALESWMRPKFRFDAEEPWAN